MVPEEFVGAAFMKVPVATANTALKRALRGATQHSDREGASGPSDTGAANERNILGSPSVTDPRRLVVLRRFELRTKACSPILPGNGPVNAGRCHRVSYSRGPPE